MLRDKHYLASSGSDELLQPAWQPAHPGHVKSSFSLISLIFFPQQTGAFSPSVSSMLPQPEEHIYSLDIIFFLSI